MTQHEKNGKKNENIAYELKNELTEESEIDLTGVDIGKLTNMISENSITRFDDSEYPDMKHIIPKLLTDHDDQTFSIIDIGAIIRQYREWKYRLPKVEPFYAVKCNSDPIILKTLASLGVGFDVASKEEISMVTNLGTGRDKIIYANPCKQPDFIKYARTQQISIMTFDNTDELLKIKLYYPDANIVLRILVDDTKSKMPFGTKFGCPMENVDFVLGYAKFLELNIIGVSFHVGSGCTDATSYSEAIKRAREVFDKAKNIGFKPYLLDIGGGFPGLSSKDEVQFNDITIAINDEIQKSFSSEENIRIIAEPGRFFATKCMTLVTSVAGKKCIKGEHGEKIYHYFITSSLYGMFNNKIFDKAIIKFKLLNNSESTEHYKSVIFGETCDSLDKIVEGIELSELACGDYLFVENHGAYTLASASKFNGFPLPKTVYILTH